MATANANVKKVLNALRGEGSVIKSWKSDDGTQWYRKWSDGFLEQGGVVSDINTEASVTVTFPLAFSSVCSVIVEKTRHNAGDAYCPGISQDSVTLSQFTVRSDRLSESTAGIGNKQKVYWRAEGF